MRSPGVLIISHRGKSFGVTENTLIAFTKAKELGTDGVELDVHLTADGELVVHHHYDLGSEKLIFKLHSSEIAALNATRDKNERIPFLEEVFESLGNNLHYEIELKASSPVIIDKVMILAQEHDLLDKIECTSPFVPLLSRLKSKYPKVRCGVFFSSLPDWMNTELRERVIVDTLHLVPAEVAHLPASFLNKHLAQQLHKARKLIHVADCNTPETVRLALSFGCDQLSTDDVGMARNIRDLI